MQRHGRAHRQIAGTEIHHAIAGLAQGQDHRVRQTIHQRAIPRQGDHKETPGAITAGHQLRDPIADHLIAEFTVFPEPQPLGCDLHRLLKRGLQRGGFGHGGG